MSKKFRIITLTAAIVFGLGGIAFGVYGATLLSKTIKSKVTYTPPEIPVDLTVSYVHYNGLPGGTLESDLFVENTGTPQKFDRKKEIEFSGPISLVGLDEFVIYKFDMAVNTGVIAGAYFKITVDIYNGATGFAENLDMDVYYSDNEIGGRIDIGGSCLTKSQYNLRTGNKNNLGQQGVVGFNSGLFTDATVYILIKGGDETDGGDKQVIFNVYFSADGTYGN